MLRTFFTTVAVGSLFVGGLAATHIAFAQPGTQPVAQGGPRGGLFAQADTNKDGKISKAELTAGLDARFAKMDVDRDGQITQKDRDAMRQQRLDGRFAAMDSDRNGQISKAEFTAAHQARAEKRAEAGKPGGKGWGRGHGRGPGRGMMHRGPGGWGDADKDGTITKAEFIAGPTALFTRADADKDGFVTADEMKVARPAMRGGWRGRNGPPSAPQN